MPGRFRPTPAEEEGFRPRGVMSGGFGSTLSIKILIIEFIKRHRFPVCIVKLKAKIMIR